MGKSEEREAARAWVAAIKKTAAEFRVLPDDLVQFVIVQGKDLERAKAIFEQYQKTGHYSENGSSFGQAKADPSPSAPAAPSAAPTPAVGVPTTAVTGDAGGSASTVDDRLRAIHNPKNR